MSNKKKTFWEFFINNRKFVFVLTLAIIVLGLVSIYFIPKESTPEVDIPIVTISTPYPGAGPEDVESLVTNVIEDEVLGLSDIQDISSQSFQGHSSIIIEFNVDVDKNKKVNDVEDAVARAEIDLPADAKESRVRDVSISEVFPVLRFSLSGPYNVNRLKEMAENVEKKLKRIKNISEVQIQGGQEREFKILVNKSSLDNYNLSLINVTSAISKANSDVPVGTIETGGENYTLNLKGQIKSKEEIKNIPITSYKDSVVYVKDVARVKDSFAEKSTISRVSINGSPSLPAVSLSVIKGSEGNILNIVDKSLAEIEKIKKTELPENVQMEIIDNQAENIRNDIKNLMDNGIQTIIIILILLLIFVGWREAILSAVAVPLTFLISFIILNYIDYTLNFLTLFALILSLGILVDSIIVITEGMNRKIAEGFPVKKAAVETVREYNLPLIAGTLTTVFAFLPMLLTSGIIGEFIKSLPVTITITLLAAMFVALGLLTSLSIRFIKIRKKKNRGFFRKKNNKSEPWLDKKVIPYYENILRDFLKSKKQRRILSLVLIILFLATLSLPMQGVLEQDLFPEQDQDYFALNIKAPVGTPLETTSAQTEKVEKIFSGDRRIKSFQVNVGSQFNTYISGNSESENLAHIIVNLKEDRKQSSLDIAEEYRRKISRLNLFPSEIKLVQLTSGPPSGAPITINITGSSLNKLEKLGTEIKKIVKETPGTANTSLSLEESNGQFSIYINRAKAKLYGVSTQQVARILRNAISGSEATVIRAGGEDTEVLVKYDLGTKEEDRIDLSSINSLTIATPQGDIPLSTFTSDRLENKRAQIEHSEGERIVKVTADTKSGFSPVNLTKKIEERINKLNLPNGYQINYGGEKEDIDQSLADMMKAFILGVFAIAMIMVLQFKSFRQPLFILITIPLATIGIFPGLVIMGQPLSFPGIIGIVALAGIVVNNAILLIDAINNQRMEGKNKKEAIIRASKIRFRPILLTTATTVLGMIPLAFSNPTWSPIAYSIIFGLSFSSVLTLLVIPLLYFSWGEEKLETLEDY